MEEGNQAEILAHFPFESGSLPVRYLGLPLLSKRMSANDYSPSKGKPKYLKVRYIEMNILLFIVKREVTTLVRLNRTELNLNRVNQSEPIL